LRKALPIQLGAIVTILALTAPASAGFFTYSEWTTLSPAPRGAYVSGVFDALTTFVTHDEDQALATHYRDCIARSKMTNMQLADNVYSFGSSHPELQRQSAPAVIGSYLFQLCGALPPPPR
jgi:hypothetical protein